jgi:hypothetical protein
MNRRSLFSIVLLAALSCAAVLFSTVNATSLHTDGMASATYSQSVGDFTANDVSIVEAVAAASLSRTSGATEKAELINYSSDTSLARMSVIGERSNASHLPERMRRSC